MLIATFGDKLEVDHQQGIQLQKTSSSDHSEVSDLEKNLNKSLKIYESPMLFPYVAIFFIQNQDKFLGIPRIERCTWLGSATLIPYSLQF